MAASPLALRKEAEHSTALEGVPGWEVLCLEILHQQKEVQWMATTRSRRLCLLVSVVSVLPPTAIPALLWLSVQRVLRIITVLVLPFPKGATILNPALSNIVTFPGYM